MALNRQPVIATEPMTRMPDEMPMENHAALINPAAASSNATQPMTVSVLPTIMSSLHTNRAWVLTWVLTLERSAFALNRKPKLDLPTDTDG